MTDPRGKVATGLGLSVHAAGASFRTLGDHAEPDGAAYLPVGYVCPDGPPGVAFRVRDLDERREFGRNLTPAELPVVSAAARLLLQGEPPRNGHRVAVDFRCPRCGAAVVAVFERVELHPAAFVYKPTFVIEARPTSGGSAA